jgi:hypothetical protein
MGRLLTQELLRLGMGLGLLASLPGGVEAQQARRGGFVFPEPSAPDFSDHEGYVPLFDGVSLKGWDGNPKFWRVENGAIVGESTAANPSGNSYIVYRDVVAKDFTLKFEIKVEGPGGSGIQYRSRTGLPWLANIPANVTEQIEICLYVGDGENDRNLFRAVGHRVAMGNASPYSSTFIRSLLTPPAIKLWATASARSRER